jgi:hypothetical protein
MPLSTFLNGVAPNQLRGAAWLALSDVGQIGAPGLIADDGGGGVAITWVYSGTIPCRIDPLSSGSGITGGQIDERSDHMVTVPPGVGVTAANRFLIDGRGTFEVTATRERTAQQTQVFEVLKIQ